MSVQRADSPIATDLLDLDNVKDELLVDVATYDALLGRLITRASQMIYEFVGRPLYRCQFIEKLCGSGTTRLQLTQRPILSIDAISLEGTDQDTSDYEIEDREAGFLYGLSGFSQQSSPVAWQITYTAGFFLVGDDYTGAISAATSDDSYNSATSAFHKFLKPGDRLLASGFTAPADNGEHLIVSATTAKIIVAENLTDESEASRTLSLENLPGLYKIAAMDLVKDMYFGRDHAVGVISEKAGPLATSYDPSRKTVNEVKRILAPMMAV